MANVYGGHQWILDTAHSAAIVGRIKLVKMEWVPAAAGDDLAVVDGASKAIWTVTNALTGGRAGVESIDFGGGRWFDGFKLSTIGGGTLYVYFA